MPLRRHGTPVLVMLLACGDAPQAPEVELGRVCGTSGPHRILALDAGIDEQLYPRANVLRVDDRLVFVTGSGGHRPEPYFSPSVSPQTTVRSTGLCGDDPRVIGHDVSRVFTDDHWPGHVFGCQGLQDLVILDPRGDAEALRVASGACRAAWTDHGLVWSEIVQPIPEEGDFYGYVRVMFMPYPDDPTSVAPPLVLLDRVPYTAEGIFAEATDDAVFALRNDDLLRISLPDGALTVEQPEVRQFDVTRDGRFVVWQVGSFRDHPEQESDIFLRDHATLVDHLIGHETLIYAPIHFDRFVLPPGSNHVLLLPDLTSLELTGWPKLETHDGRWLVESGFTGPWTLLDLVTGEQTLITDRVGSYQATPDHLDLYHDDTELWRYPYDGGAPRQLAARRASYTELADGRLVMIVDVDERWFGDLVLVDPDTLAERRIDTRVSKAASFELWSGVFDPALVAYAVSDGHRSGIWLARPAG